MAHASDGIAETAQTALIMVTGMGRSGTSLATAVLAQAGARLASDLIEDPQKNPEGMNEDAFVVAHNKAIVESLSRDEGGDVTGSADTLVPLLRALRGYLAAQTTRPGFVVKDPRFAVLLPLWRRLLADLRIRPRLVFCHRDLASTVASFGRAYGRNEIRAADIWLYRALAFLSGVRRPFFAIGYDDWARNATATVTGLRRFVGLPGDEPPDEVLQRAGLHAARPREAGEIAAALRAHLPPEVGRFVDAVTALRGRIGAAEANSLAASYPAVRAYLDERSRDYAGPFVIRAGFWEAVPVADIDALVRKARRNPANQAAVDALPSP